MARRALRRTRRGAYRVGSVLGDVDAFSSGRPRRMFTRLLNKIWGRKVIRRAWFR